MTTTKDKNGIENPAGRSEPVLPDEDRREIVCKALEEYHKKSIINNKPLTRTPKEIYEGAIYAMRLELRNNPDWLSQSAHSFRELLYPTYKHLQEDKKYKYLQENKDSFLPNPDNIVRMHEVYQDFCDLCHHGLCVEDKKKEQFKDSEMTKFKEAVEKFEKEAPEFFRSMVDILEDIEILVAKNPAEYEPK